MVSFAINGPDTAFSLPLPFDSDPSDFVSDLRFDSGLSSPFVYVRQRALFFVLLRLAISFLHSSKPSLDLEVILLLVFEHRSRRDYSYYTQIGLFDSTLIGIDLEVSKEERKDGNHLRFSSNHQTRNTHFVSEGITKERIVKEESKLAFFGPITDFWIPPVDGCLKFNVDATSLASSIETSIGGVLRDHRGKTLIRFSKSIGSSDPTGAELVAIHEACQSSSGSGRTRKNHRPARDLLLKYAILLGVLAKESIKRITRVCGRFCFLLQVNYIIFDKTETLTIGEPLVVNTRLLRNMVLHEFYELVATTEHSLAKAIIEYAKKFREDEENPAWPEARDFISITCHGMKAIVRNMEVIVENMGLILDHSITTQADAEDMLTETEGMAQTVILVSIDGEVAGVLAISDPMKPGAHEVISILKSMDVRNIMVTGDNMGTASSIARQIGMEIVIVEAKPEQKVDKVKELLQWNLQLPCCHRSP
ncbi:hypothetical protein GQ457_11G023690 [Hibiscus cannabinus]